MPVQRILVSPKVSGMIVKLDILEGRRVKKGDILAELEDVDYQADLAHAESSLEAARQRLAEIVAMLPERNRPGQGRVGAGQGRTWCS